MVAFLPRARMASSVSWDDSSRYPPRPSANCRPGEPYGWRAHLRQEDIGARFGEAYRHGLADAPGAAGDQGRLALEGEEGGGHWQTRVAVAASLRSAPDRVSAPLLYGCGGVLYKVRMPWPRSRVRSSELPVTRRGAVGHSPGFRAVTSALAAQSRPLRCISAPKTPEEIYRVPSLGPSPSSPRSSGCGGMETSSRVPW